MTLTSHRRNGARRRGGRPRAAVRLSPSGRAAPRRSVTRGTRSEGGWTRPASRDRRPPAAAMAAAAVAAVGGRCRELLGAGRCMRLPHRPTSSTRCRWSARCRGLRKAGPHRRREGQPPAARTAAWPLLADLPRWRRRRRPRRPSVARRCRQLQLLVAVAVLAAAARRRRRWRWSRTRAPASSRRSSTDDG